MCQLRALHVVIKRQFLHLLLLISDHCSTRVNYYHHDIIIIVIIIQQLYMTTRSTRKNTKKKRYRKKQIRPHPKLASRISLTADILAVVIYDSASTKINFNKNSSGVEIANVNFFTTISHTYFKIPKENLDDSQASTAHLVLNL